jgi:hypoxanthine phosphoribosyltransferase
MVMAVKRGLSCNIYGRRAYGILYAMTKPLYKELLYTEGQVNKRIAEMATEAVQRYKGRNVVFVSLLNGAAPFTAKFMSAMQKCDPEFHPNSQYMVVSRYGSEREAGEIKITTDVPAKYRDLTGTLVVVLDDLIDAGGTTEFSKKHLYAYGAEKVEVVVLVRKIKNPPVTTELAIYGFEAPDVWLTGMGMDDERLGREGNRWAGWIAVANDDNHDNQ